MRRSGRVRYAGAAAVAVVSAKVAPGWRATIYEDSGFHGGSVELTADAPDLQFVPGPCKHDSFNDCISSVRLRPQ